MNALRTAMAVLGLLVMLPGNGEMAEADARSYEPPARSAGLFIGDVVGQTLTLNDTDTLMHWQSRLPEGRVGTWLERLPLRETSDSSGRPALRIDYQIVNAPDGHVSAELPAIDDGAGRVIPAWPITIAAMLPASDSAVSSASSLLAGPGRAPLDASDRQVSFARALWALGSVLAVWLGWFLLRGWRERQLLPFARALQEIGTLPRASADDDSHAWQAVHRALDQTADQAIGVGDMDALLQQAGWLQPFRMRIMAFLSASNARFFALPPVRDGFQVKALCRALMQAERSQSS